MGAGASCADKESFLSALAKVKAENPDNLCAKYLTNEYINSQPEELQQVLYRCTRTGVENPTSQLGCYAMKPEDYAVFNEFFDKVIREYHGDDTGEKTHETNWDIEGDDKELCVSKLGVEGELSMRVRVGRNLEGFNLPGMMDKEERIKFEKKMCEAFEKLIAKEGYGGNIYSLTPDFNGETNPNLITDEKYQELVKAHIMFKNMDDDTYLKSAGISSDWPYGRGCYVSEDQQFIIWFGEEDQLRIMCMKKGTKLSEVFNRLKVALDLVEEIEGIKFASSEKYGYVTSCPSNLGTGMRASVHIRIPNLTSDGTDAKAKEICKPLGLSVRGTGGEHTPIGADGTVDISPRARLFIKEGDIIQALYKGISDLMAAEKAAAPTSDSAPASDSAAASDETPASDK